MNRSRRAAVIALPLLPSATRACVAATLLLLGGCADRRELAVEPAPEPLFDEPELVEHEARFGRRLLAGPWDLPEGGTDVIPPRAFWIEEMGQRRPAPDALDGWLTADGAVFVTAGWDLVDDRGAVIARAVPVDVCVSPEGDRIAFTQEVELFTTVMVHELGSELPPRRVTDALDDALLPFFLRDGTLLVTGGRGNERFGVFHVGRDGQPRRLTNHGLFRGEARGPRFVPIPVGARHMHELDDGRVVYFDGDAEHTISVAIDPGAAEGGSAGAPAGEVAP
jgi:hypothetical protein